MGFKEGLDEGVKGGVNWRGCCHGCLQEPVHGAAPLS